MLARERATPGKSQRMSDRSPLRYINREVGSAALCDLDRLASRSNFAAFSRRLTHGWPERFILWIAKIRIQPKSYMANIDVAVF